jgi:hypothetical protein
MESQWEVRHGKKRDIVTPSTLHDVRLRSLVTKLNRYYHPPKNVHGFVCGRSRNTAVGMHRGAKYFLHLDLVSFFGSCTVDKLQEGMSLQMFPPPLAAEVFSLCTYRGALPVLSNVAAFQLDLWLSQFPWTYTRYADNIMLSSRFPIDEGDPRRVVSMAGFRVNEQKSWLNVFGRERVSYLGLRVR